MIVLWTVLFCFSKGLIFLVSYFFLPHTGINVRKLPYCPGQLEISQDNQKLVNGCPTSNQLFQAVLFIFTKTNCKGSQLLGQGSRQNNLTLDPESTHCIFNFNHFEGNFFYFWYLFIYSSFDFGLCVKLLLHTSPPLTRKHVHSIQCQWMQVEGEVLFLQACKGFNTFTSEVMALYSQVSNYCR